MATGMAIMGFGGGAMIGAPLADLLMNHFKTPTSVGVWQTFVAMAAIYFVFMMGGAFGYRSRPPAGGRRAGRRRPRRTTMITQQQRAPARRAQDAAVLADLAGALPERLRRHRRHRHGLADAAGDLRRLADRPAGRRLHAAQRPSRRVAIAAIAAGFTGLLSLFNIGGRFFWASLSDYIGRKNTYYTFFLLGIALYALAPTLADMGSEAAVRWRLLHHPVDVWRRLRHRAGLSRRHVRHAVRRRDPRPPAHRLVDRRHHRAGGGELHPRSADRRRRAARPALQHHDVHPCAACWSPG